MTFIRCSQLPPNNFFHTIQKPQQLQTVCQWKVYVDTIPTKNVKWNWNELNWIESSCFVEKQRQKLETEWEMRSFIIPAWEWYGLFVISNEKEETLDENSSKTVYHIVKCGSDLCVSFVCQTDVNRTIYLHSELFAFNLAHKSLHVYVGQMWIVHRGGGGDNELVDQVIR